MSRSIIFIITCLFQISTFAKNINIQHWQTLSGTKVLFVRSHELPMVDINIAFKAGAAYDGKDWGLAVLTANLFEQGANGLNATKIAEEFENYGALFSNDVDLDKSTFSLRSLSYKDSLKPALKTLGIILSKPDFKGNIINREKKQQLATIRYMNEKPSSVASKAFYKALYQTTPYGHSVWGNEQTLKKINQNKMHTTATASPPLGPEPLYNPTYGTQLNTAPGGVNDYYPPEASHYNTTAINYTKAKIVILYVDDYKEHDDFPKLQDLIDTTKDTKIYNDKLIEIKNKLKTILKIDTETDTYDEIYVLFILQIDKKDTNALIYYGDDEKYEVLSLKDFKMDNNFLNTEPNKRGMWDSIKLINHVNIIVNNIAPEKKLSEKPLTYEEKVIKGKDQKIKDQKIKALPNEFHPFKKPIYVFTIELEDN